ncbi:hypothetical protein BASA60_003692 [Batrachochytrium salamandrivorans]|nr:hypothetical protein BASA60_003692 [Batrachochytrium salamandrivorans]
MSTVETASQLSETTTSMSIDSVSNVRFTCLSCHVAFPTADAQRAHMRTDWHRYNLKRKAADLPPVTADIFAQKLKDQQQKTMDQHQQALQTAECTTCNKFYASQNAYKSHLASKKHRDALVLAKSTSASSAATLKTAADSATANANLSDTEEESTRINWQDRLAAATTQDEFEIILKEKMENSRTLEESECLFCPHSADSFESNVAHMAKAHSFFIPDVDYLVDVKGLIKYLADKVAIANLCIYCNGKGRAMHSIEAVQNHMVSKGHCKMVYENGEDAEYADFYDFSPMYSDTEEDAMDADGEDEAWVDDADAATTASTVGAAKRRPTQAHISADETQLVLPSGIRVGHRSFRTYWKQNLRMKETVPGSMLDPEMISRMTGQYKLLGYTAGNGLFAHDCSGSSATCDAQSAAT